MKENPDSLINLLVPWYEPAFIVFQCFPLSKMESTLREAHVSSSGLDSITAVTCVRCFGLKSSLFPWGTSWSKPHCNIELFIWLHASQQKGFDADVHMDKNMAMYSNISQTLHHNCYDIVTRRVSSWRRMLCSFSFSSSCIQFSNTHIFPQSWGCRVQEKIQWHP